MSNGLDPDQDQHSVKGIQQVTKVAASKERVNLNSLKEHFYTNKVFDLRLFVTVINF